MLEKIYTIPINEAFDESKADPTCGCPFCTISEKLGANEIDLILGASMMEPDVRIKTNASGFCRRHYDRMLGAKNRLGLALMLESHLAELRSDMKDNPLTALKPKNKGNAAAARIEKLSGTCYVCERVEASFTKMYDNAVWLWEQDKDFRAKFAEQPYFCLPHYKRLLEVAKKELSGKVYPEFYSAAEKVTMGYFDSLSEDVSWFCKKFDYRYDAEPWGNAKDSPDRAVKFLCGRDTVK